MKIKEPGVINAIVFIVGIAAALFVTFQRNDTTNRTLFSSAAVPDEQTIAPTIAPLGPEIPTMDSPEGSKTLTLKKEGSLFLA